MTAVAQIFVLLFPAEIVLILTKHGSGYIRGEFFANSSGHLERLLKGNNETYNLQLKSSEIEKNPFISFVRFQQLSLKPGPLVRTLSTKVTLSTKE
jgi:hypothetical protein